MLLLQLLADIWLSQAKWISSMKHFIGKSCATAISIFLYILNSRQRPSHQTALVVSLHLEGLYRLEAALLTSLHEGLGRLSRHLCDHLELRTTTSRERLTDETALMFTRLGVTARSWNDTWRMSCLFKNNRWVGLGRNFIHSSATRLCPILVLDTTIEVTRIALETIVQIFGSRLWKKIVFSRVWLHCLDQLLSQIVILRHHYIGKGRLFFLCLFTYVTKRIRIDISSSETSIASNLITMVIWVPILDHLDNRYSMTLIWTTGTLDVVIFVIRESIIVQIMSIHICGWVSMIWADIVGVALVWSTVFYLVRICLHLTVPRVQECSHVFWLVTMVAVISDWIELGWLTDNVIGKLLLKVMEMALINILLTKHVLNMLGA